MIFHRHVELPEGNKTGHVFVPPSPSTLRPSFIDELRGDSIETVTGGDTLGTLSVARMDQKDREECRQFGNRTSSINGGFNGNILEVFIGFE